MAKQDLVVALRGALQEQYDRMLAAAKSAEAYATDADSRAESKYDTRSLEASYLAAGQGEKVEELGDALQLLETWKPRDFEPDEAMAVGALVEVDTEEDDLCFFLLAPAGGGVALDYLGCELIVLTMNSPLGQRLEGRKVGDVVDGLGTIDGVE
ncbi:MAG: transcription elongation factor GreAB [Verrucomicrobiota bacterium]